MQKGSSNYCVVDKRLLPQGRYYVAKFNTPFQEGSAVAARRLLLPSPQCLLNGSQESHKAGQLGF